MKKIPVGATIAHAYRFAFGQAPTLLRAIWLPLLIQLVVVFFLIKRSVLLFAAMQAQDPSVTTLIGPVLLLFVPAAILFFVQLTAAMETALGEPPRSWFYFPIGRKMWRLLGGFLAGVFSIIAVGLGALLIIWVIAVGLDLVLKAAPGTRPVIAILGGLLVAIYGYGLFFFAIRFLFLLAPSNVSEPTLGVARAWHLSAGNFWRAFLIILAIILPLSIIQYAFEVALAGFPPVGRGMSKEAAQAAEMTWRIAEMNAMANRWYLTLPLTGVLMLFQFGAGCAAQAFAYRALTENDASAPVAGNGLPD
ncbi:MAG TPA: hypothetical protein VIG39_04390 [Rhizomicrobium sp.]